MDQSVLAEGTEMVLLVEGESRVQNMVVQVLEDYDYKGLKACKGAEVSGVAKEHLGGKMSLLLTDAVMPHLISVEFAEGIQWIIRISK